MKTNLIGFDLDDTLCYPETAFESVFEQAFGFALDPVGPRWRDAISMNNARSGVEAVKAVLPNASDDQANAMLIGFSHLWAKQQKLFDGAKAMLRQMSTLPDTQLVLITNGPSVMQHTVIEHLEIAQYFDKCFATGDEALGVNKPHKACFEKVVNIYGVDAKDCLFIGDGFKNDYLGAKSAGWDSIWVKPTNAEQGGSIEDYLDLTQKQSEPHIINWNH